MKLIQILVVAASLAVSAVAQTGSQNSDGAAPSTSKQQSSTATGTDSQKKNSAKPNAASKKTGDSSTPPEKIPVISVGTTNGKATTSAGASKNNYKAATPTSAKTPATTSSSSSTAGKTPVTTNTGKMTPATGTASSSGTTGKTAASGKPGSQAAASQGKQTPVIPVGPASKQTTGKQTASQQPASKQPAAKQPVTQSKGTGKNPPVMVKTPPEPKVTIKKPSKAELVAASKVSSKISSGGRRDPFVSPIRAVSPQAPSGPKCSTGKQCLAINELVLQGTAKDVDGRMIAIVASTTHQFAYFLRENDQVFNGTVQRITKDFVVFRESAVDSLGRQTTHEVVKRINPT